MSDRDALDVERAQRGDTAAFSELIERHERRTYNLALRVCGDAELARDATQEAWLTAFRKLGQFRGDSAFTTWLHRVTVNASLDLLRKERRAPLLVSADDDDAVDRSGPAVADHTDETAGSLDAADALTRIPVEFRTALVLHDVLDLPYEEVASVLEIPIGTVRSRLHRGRIALAAAIESERGREPHGKPASSNPGVLPANLAGSDDRSTQEP